MRRSVLSLAATLALTAPLTAQSAADSAAIRTVVGKYMHGLKFNDVQDFKAAFWPSALLLWRRGNDSLGTLTQADWYKGFATVAGKEEQGTLKIVSMDITRDIANVKVFEDYATTTYTNYLSLVKFGGAWKIVNKVYTSTRKP